MTIHEPDHRLIKHADGILNRRASAGLPAKEHERLSELRQGYAVSCRLAKGPDASRAAHWSEKARELWERLKAAVARHGDDCGDSPC